MSEQCKYCGAPETSRKVVLDSDFTFVKYECGGDNVDSPSTRRPHTCYDAELAAAHKRISELLAAMRDAIASLDAEAKLPIEQRLSDALDTLETAYMAAKGIPSAAAIGDA